VSPYRLANVPQISLVKNQKFYLQFLEPLFCAPYIHILQSHINTAPLRNALSGGSKPTYESDLIHHNFVQFGKNIRDMMPFRCLLFWPVFFKPFLGCQNDTLKFCNDTPNSES